jgi:processive 1,2-diacylglycerol beta-glucosyltransferase
MKKILIFYGSYGGGHLSAAKSIRDYIEKNYSDSQVELVDCVEYVNKLFNKLTTKAYKDFSKNARWIWKHLYYDSESGSLSRICNTINRLMAIKLNRLIQEFQPDLIISTHPFSSQMCAILKEKGKLNCKVATILTDYAPHNQWLVKSEFIDYYFVAQQGMVDDLVSRGVNKDKIHVTGIPLSSRFLQSYNKQKILEDYGLTSDKNTILFFAGGEFGFGKDKTFNRLKAIIDNLPNLQVVAVAGRNEKMKERFDELVKTTRTESNVKILSFTNQVPELMSVSDLVITKPGGLTTTESLASGLPLIIIDPLPGQEEENAEFIENSGAGIWVKDSDNIESILLDIFNSPTKLEDMKSKARLIAKKNSTQNIVETLLG